MMLIVTHNSAWHPYESITSLCAAVGERMRFFFRRRNQIMVLLLEKRKNHKIAVHLDKSLIY
jgi:hypothetical protein